MKNKMRVYISGKITGTDDYIERFQEAEKRINDLMDVDVINPAKICSMIPKDAFTHNEYMELCMLLLSKCDYIYLMKGWEESAGANMEYGYAVSADKIILKE